MPTLKYRPAVLLTLLLLASTNHLLAATPVRIAVAANFQATLHELIRATDAEPGTLDVISGSTGTLYAQIRNGAPYDLFLAADSSRPVLLVEAGLTASPAFTYAIGQLVFWAPGLKPPVTEATLQALQAPVALANPRLAPYGQAALEVLMHSRSDEGRRVYGNNINQTFQFVESGNAPAGFVALSQVKGRYPPESWWQIPQARYPAIRQQAVLLNGDNPAASAFFAFLGSASAREIIRAAGYDVDAPS